MKHISLPSFNFTMEPISQAMKPLPTLHWTTEPPKVPGWYWAKSKRPERSEIRWITSFDLGCPSHAMFLWAGPIPEPLDPEPDP